MAKSKAVKAAPETFKRLQQAHPDAHCELDHASPFQLIVATVLSAQSTDVAVNKVTPDLFKRWPTPEALAEAPLEEVETTLNRLGMFRQKSKNIVGLANKLVTEHGGAVPQTLEQLVALPGVGRKTANVVLGVAFNAPEGVVVDTHVQRITQRLGWTKNTTPEKIEQDLMKLFPREVWDPISHTLIFHGRRICTARNPACSACTLTDACPNAFNAEHVGRKPPKSRTDRPAKKASAKKTAARKTSAKKTAAKKATSATSKSGASTSKKKAASTTRQANAKRAASAKKKTT